MFSVIIPDNSGELSTTPMLQIGGDNYSDTGGQQGKSTVALSILVLYWISRWPVSSIAMGCPKLLVYLGFDKMHREDFNRRYCISNILENSAE